MLKHLNSLSLKQQMFLYAFAPDLLNATKPNALASLLWHYSASVMLSGAEPKHLPAGVSSHPELVEGL